MVLTGALRKETPCLANREQERYSTVRLCARLSNSHELTKRSQHWQGIRLPILWSENCRICLCIIYLFHRLDAWIFRCMLVHTRSRPTVNSEKVDQDSISTESSMGNSITFLEKFESTMGCSKLFCRKSIRSASSHFVGRAQLCRLSFCLSESSMIKFQSSLMRRQCKFVCPSSPLKKGLCCN